MTGFNGSRNVTPIMPGRLGESRVFEARKTLLNQGDDDHCLYILEWGAVEIIKNGAQIAVVTQPGAVFGESSALLEIAQPVTVRTVDRACLRVIPQAHIACRSNPRLTLFIAQRLARRCNGLDNVPPSELTALN